MRPSARPALGPTIAAAAVVVVLAYPVQLALAVAGDVLLGDGDFIVAYGASPRTLLGLLVRDLRVGAPALAATGLLIGLLRIAIEASQLGSRSGRTLISLGAALGLGAGAGAVFGGVPLGLGLGLGVGLVLSVIGAVTELALRRLTMRRQAAVVLVLGASAISPARADTVVLLIGGGPRPAESQVQIELNVEWIQSILRTRKADAQIFTFFASGQQPGVRDVVVHDAVDESSASHVAWARVFGMDTSNRYRFYGTRLRSLEGASEKQLILGKLRSLATSLGPADDLLILYQGHGSPGGEDLGATSLRLWQDEQLSARELGAALDALDPQVRVRFVLPQCYSGGFERLIRPQGADTAGIVDHLRCGFFSQDARREAEGCAGSPAQDEYRDYSSAFFAALDGRARAGREISRGVDRDGDGLVGLDEAHAYAVVSWDTVDVPRSTSEVFLERWQPWATRWLSFVEPPGSSRYAQLAQAIATRIGLPETGAALAATVQRRLAETRESLARAQEAGAEADEVRRRWAQGLRLQVEERWPAALWPHTRGYFEFVRDDLGAAETFVSTHPDYAELVRATAHVDDLAQQALALRRQAATLERILRLRRLARVETQLLRSGSASARRAYDQLLRCEQAPL